MAPLSISCNQNCGMFPLLPPIKCRLPIPCILVALLSPLQLLPFPSLTSRKEQTDGQIDCIRNGTAVAIQTEFKTVFLAMFCFCLYGLRSTRFIFFDVLLTVHLSIFISVINQLDAQNFCFTISLFHDSTCFEHMCSKHVES